MTEQNEGRHLTRRELRLREMEATGAIPVVDEQAAHTEAAAAGVGSASAIEIALFDENGRMRSRRELRELREQAEAALRAEREEADAPAEPIESIEVPEPVEPEAEAQSVFAFVEREAEPEPGLGTEPGRQAAAEPESTEELLAETVAFDVILDQAQADLETRETGDESAEAEPAAEPEVAVDPLQAYLSRFGDDEADSGVVDSGASDSVGDGSADVAARQAPEATAPRPAPVDSLMGGAISVFVAPHEAEGDVFGAAQERSGDPEPVEAAEFELAGVPASSAASEFSEFPETSDLFVIPVSELPADASDIFESPFAPTPGRSSEQAAALPAFKPEPDAEPQLDAEAKPSIFLTEPKTEKQVYSFPDIAPLDEGRSVFDDPAIRMMGAANAQQARPSSGGDFDELIDRAVAQEGAAGSTNTSALILPNMPEADSLAGPLGETGELYITGSIDLPKSLGATGGHSALHDSVEIQPLDELGELGFAEAQPRDGLMAPVSASRAVSARATQGPLMADAAKDKSKMPLVLIATGGVLVVGATGLIIWAAASGLFG